MAYSDKVIEHYENPRNVGSLDKDDPTVGTGLVGAPACGDVMRLQIKVSDDGVMAVTRITSVLRNSEPRKRVSPRNCFSRCSAKLTSVSRLGRSPSLATDGRNPRFMSLAEGIQARGFACRFLLGENVSGDV